MLIVFLPGYFLVERLRLLKNPLFASIVSMSFSFLLSPLIVLPGSMLLGSPSPLLIAISIDLFLLVMAFLMKNRERMQYTEKDHSPWLLPLMILICSWIFIYTDLTKIGPYVEDWTYLFGIVKELSRNLPPQDPEASFLLLKYQWGFWFFYALIHSLGGVSVWQVFEFIPVPLSFAFLGLVYMILFRTTKNKEAGLWAIILLTIGRHSEWILRGFQGLGWTPGYYDHMSWLFTMGATGYSLLWGWYTLPGLIPPLVAFLFLIHYQQENQKRDLWLSLGACSIGPFFHPVFYFSFLGGFSIILLFQWLRRKFDPWLLLFYLTFLPYFLTSYLYLKPDLPNDPIYQFFLNRIFRAGWFYLGLNGIAIPFALLALWTSREARTWFLPFAFLFSALSILGVDVVNPTHVMLQDGLYLSLLSAIGLSYLKKINRLARSLIYLLVLLVILPPYILQTSLSLKNDWPDFSFEQKTAAEFIRTSTKPQGSFIILPDSKDSTDVVEGLGERKVILGVLWHLARYESLSSITTWKQEAKNFFLTPDYNKRQGFIRSYQVNYIFLGPGEIEYMLHGGADIPLFKRGYKTIYRNREIEILETGL